MKSAINSQVLDAKSWFSPKLNQFHKETKEKMSNGNITHILHLSPYPYAAPFETFSGTPSTIWDPPVYLAVESKLNIHQKQIRPKRTLFSAPSKDIAKYFHKFVHTRNFREVTGLNLLSNIFNFCWLTLVSQPRIFVFRLLSFVNFL